MHIPAITIIHLIFFTHDSEASETYLTEFSVASATSLTDVETISVADLVISLAASVTGGTIFGIASPAVSVTLSQPVVAGLATGYFKSVVLAAPIVLVAVGNGVGAFCSTKYLVKAILTSAGVSLLVNTYATYP